MKTWNKPTIEELDVNETAFSVSGAYSDDGFFNGLTMQMGWSDIPLEGDKPSPDKDITDALS